MIYLIWCAIYLVISFDIQQLLLYGYIKVTYWKFHHVLQHPIETIFTGTKTQLWFLPALICSQLFVLYLYKFHRKMLLPISLILYLIGVLGGAYQKTRIGIYLPFDPRNGIFFASVFLVIGFFIYQFNYRVSSFKALTLLIFGFLGHLFEVRYLWHNFDLDPTTIDFVFSTLPFGLGVALFVFSLKSQPSEFLSHIGRYTLGIYLVHMLFIELFRPFSSWLSPIAYAFFVPVAVYMCSLFVVIIFNKHRALQLVFR